MRDPIDPTWWHSMPWWERAFIIAGALAGIVLVTFILYVLVLI